MEGSSKNKAFLRCVSLNDFEVEEAELCAVSKHLTEDDLAL
jgi:hypothetical protein